MFVQLAAEISSEQARPQRIQVRIPSDPGEARRIQEDIAILLKAHQYNEHDIFGIRLAVEEAIINAIKHGNRLDRSKHIDICYHVCTERFECSVADQGDGFDPAAVPDPTTAENLERPCGRGLMLMRHYMTRVSFNASGNSVFLYKLRRQSDS